MLKKIIVLFVLFLPFTFIFADDFVVDEPSSSQPVSIRSPIANSAPAAIGSVPTAESFGRGHFYTDFILYENGGVKSSVIVGVFDMLALGISENFDGLIGSGDVNVNIPGAYIRINILRDFNHLFWAIGFDSFVYGKNGTYFGTNNQRPATIYGFYTALSWRYSAFGGNDVVSTGLRFPLLPAEARDLTNTSLFFGISVALSPFFMLGFTLENFYLSFSRPEQILPSLIVSFVPTPPFKVMIVFQYEFYSGKLNRILSLNYDASF
jgi:hypothetical protein